MLVQTPVKLSTRIDIKFHESHSCAMTCETGFGLQFPGFKRDKKRYQGTASHQRKVLSELIRTCIRRISFKQGYTDGTHKGTGKLKSVGSVGSVLVYQRVKRNVDQAIAWGPPLVLLTPSIPVSQYPQKLSIPVAKAWVFVESSYSVSTSARLETLF